MKQILLFLATLVALNTFAQIPEPEDTVESEAINPAAAIRHVLQPLDKSEITTGLLFDAGLPLVNFDAVRDTETPYVFSSWKEWARLYNSTFTMALDSADAIPTIETWRQTAESYDTRSRGFVIRARIFPNPS